MSRQSETVDLTTKLVYDRDDPNRPRFTLQELKEILYERNELKARVSDLEDELQLFRPKDQRSYVLLARSPFLLACDVSALVVLVQACLWVLRMVLQVCGGGPPC